MTQVFCDDLGSRLANDKAFVLLVSSSLYLPKHQHRACRLPYHWPMTIWKHQAKHQDQKKIYQQYASIPNIFTLHVMKLMLIRRNQVIRLMTCGAVISLYFRSRLLTVIFNQEFHGGRL